MVNSNNVCSRARRRAPRGQPHEMPESDRTLWCQVRDTPWARTMRCQVATAALVGALPGFTRAWRFTPNSSH